MDPVFIISSAFGPFHRLLAGLRMNSSRLRASGPAGLERLFVSTHAYSQARQLLATRAMWLYSHYRNSMVSAATSLSGVSRGE
eukprot:scaffold619154_cov18-Prasinocladus_malaysianus.AAC.1